MTVKCFAIISRWEGGERLQKNIAKIQGIFNNFSETVRDSQI